MDVTQEPASLRFFTAKDADPRSLDGECVAVVGYGFLGRTVALNVRDSGVSPLVIGNVADRYADRARADGFVVLPIAEAVAASDVVPRVPITSRCMRVG